MAKATIRRLRRENSMMRFSSPPRPVSVVVMMPSFLSASLAHILELVGAGDNDFLPGFHTAEDFRQSEIDGPDPYRTALVTISLLHIDDLDAFVFNQGRDRHNERILAPAGDDAGID